MNTRIHFIRQEAKLSGVKFSKLIGISESALRKLESGENNPSEGTIRSICREFNVNREWLESGKGSIHAEREETTIERLVRQNSLSKLTMKLLTSFEELSDEQQASVLAYAQRFVDSVVASPDSIYNPTAPAPIPDLDPNGALRNAAEAALSQLGLLEDDPPDDEEKAHA